MSSSALLWPSEYSFDFDKGVFDPAIKSNLNQNYVSKRETMSHSLTFDIIPSQIHSV